MTNSPYIKIMIIRIDLFNLFEKQTHKKLTKLNNMR